MEKILNIDGRPVKFKSTGAFLLRYKQQFKRDALKDIFKLSDAVEEVRSIEKNETTGEELITISHQVKDIDALDLEVFYNLIWTLAKTADKDIPPPIDWLDTFDSFVLDEILTDLSELIFSNLGATVESKKK